MALVFWSLLLWAMAFGVMGARNISGSLFTNTGHDIGLFLADDNCPSRSLCREPLGTKSKVMPQWDELNCQCDDACATYGDCCVNAVHFDAEQTRMARHHWRCVNLAVYNGIYMLATCPATWGDPETRSMCERRQEADSTAPRDPLAATPVTNPRTQFTYSNYYCALCNEDSDSAIFWTPRVECGELAAYNATYGNVTNEFVWDHLRFDAITRSWGVALPGFNFTHHSPNQTLVSGFATCNVLVEMPNTATDLVRRCHTWVDDCPAGWSNATVRHLCYSYTAVVYGNRSPEVSYRNVHCAICNEENLEMLNCNNEVTYRHMNPATFAPSFAFLFDINEAGGNVVGTKRRCKGKGEIFDPFFKTCRPMVCASTRYKLRQGRCILVEAPETSTVAKPATTTTLAVYSSSGALLNSTLVLPPNVTEMSMPGGGNGTESEEASMAPTTGFPDASATDCARFNISQVLFQIFANGSIYIEKYDRLYSPKEYVAKDDGSILVCIPLSEDNAIYMYQHKFSIILAYLTLAGLGISLTCIFFHLLAFMVVPSLRNLSGKNLASLCVALIGAYITFIISQFDNAVSKEVCTVIAVTLYYSFLASFFWMNCIAFDVWRTLRLATIELRVSSGQQWSKFVAYSAYSWFGPAVIVAVSIIVENSSKVPTIFRPHFGTVSCWFGSRRALLIFFVTPVVTIVILNIFMFALSAHIIVSASQPASSQKPGSKARRNFRLYLRLALIMGLTWVFGIVAGQVDKEPLWYVFVVLNTLQGLFIFLSFTCTDKVWAYLRDRVFIKKGSSYYTSRGAQARKFELEGRDSGSGESQSSQTSHLSFTRTSQMSRTSSNKK